MKRSGERLYIDFIQSVTLVFQQLVELTASSLANIIGRMEDPDRDVLPESGLGDEFQKHEILYICRYSVRQKG